MKLLLIWLHIQNFFSDKGVLASMWTGFWAAFTPNMVITIALGAPSAIYVSLKIWREFIYPWIRKPYVDPKLLEDYRKKAEKTQNGKISKDYEKNTD